MSDINLQRFVNIDIRYHEQASVTSTRDTVVYLDLYGDDDTVFSNFAEAEADADASDAFKDWAETFFKNGGVKIHYIGTNGDAIDVANVKSLKDEEVVVCIEDYATALSIAQALKQDDTVYGIKQKIIVCYSALQKTEEVKNLAVKYSTFSSDCATIAAYLSRIDFHKADTVQDYCYTKETVATNHTIYDDKVLSDVLTNNMNCDVKLAGKIVNLGGNLKDGKDLVNGYSLIVLQQLLTDRLINLLLTKIKGSKGVSEIQAVVADEMRFFAMNGYLSTDKIWKDDTLTVNYNGKTYVIIEQDEPLLLGYKFVTLPIQSLTDEDKAARKAPPMYLVVADSYGIRAVTISGEVI